MKRDAHASSPDARLAGLDTLRADERANETDASGKVRTRSGSLCRTTANERRRDELRAGVRFSQLLPVHSAASRRPQFCERERQLAVVTD